MIAIDIFQVFAWDKIDLEETVHACMHYEFSYRVLCRLLEKYHKRSGLMQEEFYDMSWFVSKLFRSISERDGLVHLVFFPFLLLNYLEKIWNVIKSRHCSATNCSGLCLT